MTRTRQDKQRQDKSSEQTDAEDEWRKEEEEEADELVETNFINQANVVRRNDANELDSERRWEWGKWLENVSDHERHANEFN